MCRFSLAVNFFLEKHQAIFRYLIVKQRAVFLEECPYLTLIVFSHICSGMRVGKAGAKCKDFKEYVNKCLCKLGLKDKISEVCIDINFVL